MSKKLGKISSARVGFDSDGRFGFWLKFTGEDMGAEWSMHYWPLKPSNTSSIHKQIEEKRKVIIETIECNLKLAKKTFVSELLGSPVEIEFDEMGKLMSWRILTEVL